MSVDDREDSQPGPSDEAAKETSSTENAEEIEKLKSWVAANDIRLDDLEAENEEYANRIEALESRIDVLEKDSSSKEAKIREIVDYASNIRSKDQQSVKLTPKEIKGNAGVSRRYAYVLVDEEDGLPADYHWLLSAKQAREQQYGNAELDWDESTKGLVVDFEALHSDPEAVNKFTTRDSTEGGVE